MSAKDSLDPHSTYRSEVARGNVSEAYSIALQAAHLYEKRGDLKQAAICRRDLSEALFIQGRYDEAVAEADLSAEIQPDVYERARSLVTLAAGLMFSSKYNAAFTALGRSEEIGRAFRNDSRLMAEISACRGLALDRTNDVDQALWEYEEAARLFTLAGCVRKAAAQFNNLSYLLARHQQLKAAEQYVLTALELITRDPNPHIEAAICDSAGFICARLGRYAEAEAFVSKAVSLFEHNYNKAELLPALLHLSEMQEQCGHQKAARETARRALDLAAAVNLDPVRDSAQNRLLDLQSSNSKILTKPFLFHGLIYTSQEMKSVVARLKILAVTSETVLLLGETGTGKELIARAIHQESKRCKGPFIPFNCSAISRELIESRLFGYRRGAFTGAESEQIGIVRAAAGGTLLLDEIGDLSLAAQGALLRFLQSGEIQPLGQNKPIKIDVRVIAATNRDLNEDLESGRFREDLYFRLSVCTLRAPTLRSRPQDVPILANHFACVYSEQYNLPAPVFTVDELSRLAALRWNGNVRELESYVKRRVMFGTDAIETSEVLFNQQDRLWRALTPTEKLRRLNEGLLANKGNITSTAKRLGISRRTIQRIKKADGSGH